jgi:2-keto-3-deoxy-L-rhamnonate aldolase RhmA
MLIAKTTAAADRMIFVAQTFAGAHYPPLGFRGAGRATATG